ncbi:MAG: T9SS type A sorting domain-containing protein [Saprospiraceae bacterium]
MLFLLLGSLVSKAQLPNGSTCPNFTGTDLNGNQWTLYDLLDANKTVYIEVSATWCGPCWAYHQAGHLKNLWNNYGPPGTDQAFVLFIEGDANTNTACLYGPAGCVGGTQGDWVTGTPFPIIDDHTIRALLQVSAYPTIYMVCPANKKIYNLGQQSMNGLWNARTNLCPEPVVNVSVVNVKNTRCYGSSTGAVSITMSGGTPPYTFQWSNGATTQNLNNVPAGVYTCTVTSSNGWMGVSDPATVEDPPGPIEVQTIEVQPLGCNGIPGTITVSASGGWGGHLYAWSNGQTGESINGFNQGNYTVTVTDSEGCTKTHTVSLPGPTLPVAVIAPAPTITCLAPTPQLDGTASSQGNEFSYQWFANNGGNIIAGATTLTPTINAAGNYTLRVTNNNNTCQVFSTVAVVSNQSFPGADAGPNGEVTCAQPATTLSGDAPAGQQYQYQWTAINGGNIVSGANTLNPEVNAGGEYILAVTNTGNGCVSRDTASVSANNATPSVSLEAEELTCAVNEIAIQLTTNAQNAAFEWTGPNGFESEMQNPVVSEPGEYAVSVLNPSNGCIGADTIAVTLDNTPPGANATGGTLTCVVNSVTISASANSSHAVFHWEGPNGFESAEQNPTVNIPGVYALTVSDTLNGCTSLAEAIVVLDDAAPEAQAQPLGTLNCNDTQVEISGQGSSQGQQFTYLWTTQNGHFVSGENTLNPIVDAAGDYMLLVANNANGCTATVSTAVVQDDPVSVTLQSVNGVSCFGSADGSAAVSGAGGNGTLSYLWSNGAQTPQAANLTAGIYQVTVTDGENCSATLDVAISEPDLLLANAQATAETANGANDGTASAAPSGGTPNYAYLWNNGETVAQIDSLAPGVYTVTVTDANGCSAVQSVTVNSFNCTLQASYTQTNVTCFGNADGTAEIALIGANEPVEIIWSNGQQGPLATGLAAGQYSAEIMDAAGCPSSLTIQITQPAALQANASATAETANGANDGTANALPVGGSGGYTYLWSTGAQTQQITGLSPGTYSVTVTDANGCVSQQSVTVNAFGCAIQMVGTVEAPLCHNSCGKITLQISGANLPYTVSWSNGENSPQLNCVSPGNYCVTVLDNFGCQQEECWLVTAPAPLIMAEVALTHPVCPNAPEGAISVSPEGGVPGYTYLWSNGSTESSIQNVTVGEYSVSVTDANGCAITSTFALSATDITPPAIDVQNTTLSINAAGLAEVNAATLGLSVADNCAVVSVSIEPALFHCEDIGVPQNVSITATDAVGLSTTLEVAVQVVDNIAPQIACPANHSACIDDNIVTYNPPIVSDNCPISNDWVLVGGLPSGSEFPVGVTEQTISYTDKSGNSATCSFEVTIFEAPAEPEALIQNDVNNQGLGAIDITPAGGLPPYQFLWTSGANTWDTEDLSGLFAGVYVLQIKDANGCSYSGSYEVQNSTSATEPEWARGMRVWPNPTAGLLRLQFAQAPDGDLRIEIFDPLGRLAAQYRPSVAGAFATLDLSALPSGAYLLRIGHAEGYTTLRVAVQK